MEVAGVIKEVVQGVAKWKVGDKVCALLGGGGYAEYTIPRHFGMFDEMGGLNISVKNKKILPTFQAVVLD